MARVKGGTISHTRRKKILKQAKGFFGSKHLLWKSADEQVLHALKDAYVGRRDLKSDYRKLWIRRINAACRLYDISYSRFICGLTKAGVLSKSEGGINRKMLSEMAINDPEAFKLLVEAAKKAETKPVSVAK
jgi:large subunit ribosomal protein L20